MAFVSSGSSSFSFLHCSPRSSPRSISWTHLFMPVCLLHGQLSILVFFLYPVAFSCFKRGKPFAAGIAVGLAARPARGSSDHDWLALFLGRAASPTDNCEPPSLPKNE